RDGLLAFAQSALPRPKAVFTALGEPSAERYLAQRIHGYLGARAVVPEAGQIWEISRTSVHRV
ncbi:MAG: hypothetical protein UY97_C0015G0016, partial [Parcubacteria group bacterium GW2011_GWB1_57_6]